jgi:hypothetical protein
LNTTELALTLLKAWVLLVDNVEFAFAANDFAIGAPLFDGSTNFHEKSGVKKDSLKENYLYR